MKRIIVSILTLFTLAACSVTRTTPAPVVNGTSPKAVAPTTVSSPVSNTSSTAGSATPAGTTINKVDNDDDGTVVNTTTTATSTKPPVAKKKTASAAAIAAPAAVSSSSANLGNIQWLTPTQGKIVLPYSVAAKGVDIEGREGQAIVAAAAGKVAYSGSGLKGYGNLIIIKHADNYLTAYSHNKVNLVKEGDSVKRGQKIAELGKTDSDRPLLHFEIRKSGKPINPTSIFNKPAE
ncbi:MAG: peptidoglycan DD-metalloendopeptidase family protein [Burkholderiales bacterium]|jgi:lipoprotein NlpD|nr:peptidoglycan DD-metalloendopeptidase family protein [Burkholderiales bacterium]MBP9768990.1 peptidoglycan DD-metalloendopeptidase family protein [Burkholderiales bacterium]